MDSSSGLASTLLPLLGLFVLVVAGWFAVVRVRRWMRDTSEDAAAFTLEDLRRLRRDGKITEDEFNRAREAMIGSIRSKASGGGKAGDAPEEPSEGE
ncbi:MAG: hypothetical protein ACO3QC_03825 [Phycisphaerales bacterium]